MDNPVRYLTLGLTGIFLLALAATTQANPSPSWAEIAVMGNQALQNGDYAAAARDYEVAAQRAPAQHQPALLLSAAECALKVNDTPRAAQLLDRIPVSALDAAQNRRLKVARSVLDDERHGIFQDAQQGQSVAATPPPAVPAATAAVALLLPLSGQYAGVSAAIRDGFMTSYLHSGGKVPVRVYDTGDSITSVNAAYQHALREGAGMIVGPLRKEYVAAFAAQTHLPVSVLALNTLDQGSAVPPHLYQYGLAPEDEARAAAERAVADGARRAVAMVPQSEWGDRVLAAFSQRLTQLGGGVLKTARYTSGQTDFSDAIRDLLNLDASKDRHDALTSVIGIRTEYQPRRRDDVDFIFLAARRSDARLILPQFRFFRATALPVYATSLIYDGTSDPDVNGVTFCDMPWILQPDGVVAAQRAEVAGLASAQAQPRLFAFGMDAWTLVSRIQSDNTSPGVVYPSATGGLEIGANGVVARRLNCARFVDGLPQLLNISLPAAGQ